MAEYIKRETAVRAVMAVKWVDGSDGAMAMEIVASLPAADVAPVVRCKDCKYLRVYNTKEIYAFCPKINTVFLPFKLDTRTHFCSCGERKGTNNDGSASDTTSKTRLYYVGNPPAGKYDKLEASNNET